MGRAVGQCNIETFVTKARNGRNRGGRAEIIHGWIAFF
jgi:hypothetical protein